MRQQKLAIIKQFSRQKLDKYSLIKLKYYFNKKHFIKLNFETDKLVENLAALIAKIKTHKKGPAGILISNNLFELCSRILNHLIFLDSFITSCVLFAPPSTEKFRVDISRFTQSSDEEYQEKESITQ